MFRSLCCAFAVGVLAVAAGAADDEAVTLKDYEAKVGDRVRVTEEDRTTTRSVIVRDGKREDKLERKVKVVVYVAETLAVKKGEKKPVRSKRTYEKAEETTDGTTEKLPLHGKTVIIEKKGDKHVFTDEDGKKLSQDAEGALEKEFAKKKEDSIDDFIPRRPLKVGETWKLDTKKLLADAVADKFTADEKRAAGSGTLTRAYTFGGHRYAGFDIKMDIPLTEMNDGAKLALKPGSSMSMHMAAEGNVAGTEPDGTATLRINMLMLFEAGGVDASIRVEGLMTMNTEALPPRKRD